MWHSGVSRKQHCKDSAFKTGHCEVEFSRCLHEFGPAAFPAELFKPQRSCAAASSAGTGYSNTPSELPAACSCHRFLPSGAAGCFLWKRSPAQFGRGGGGESRCSANSFYMARASGTARTPRSLYISHKLRQTSLCGYTEARCRTDLTWNSCLVCTLRSFTSTSWVEHSSPNTRKQD